MGLFITFSQAHHEAIGLTALAIFTFLYGMRAALGAAKHLPIALVGLITAFIAATSFATPASFVLLVTIWAVAQAATDFLNGDSISATLALLLALLFGFVPMDIMSSVGFFGAYLIVSGVHLGIAAYAPRKK